MKKSICPGNVYINFSTLPAVVQLRFGHQLCQAPRQRAQSAAGHHGRHRAGGQGLKRSVVLSPCASPSGRRRQRQHRFAAHSVRVWRRPCRNGCHNSGADILQLHFPDVSDDQRRCHHADNHHYHIGERPQRSGAASSSLESGSGHCRSDGRPSRSEIGPFDGDADAGDGRRRRWCIGKGFDDGWCSVDGGGNDDPIFGANGEPTVETERDREIPS